MPKRDVPVTQICTASLMSTVPTLLRFTGGPHVLIDLVTAAWGRYALRTPQVSIRQGGHGELALPAALPDEHLLNGVENQLVAWGNMDIRDGSRKGSQWTNRASYTAVEPIAWWPVSVAAWASTSTSTRL